MRSHWLNIGVGLVLTSCLACGDDGGDSNLPSIDGGSNPTFDGGGNDDLTCNPSLAAADACGGDLNGTWTVIDACSDFDYTTLIDEQCPEATQTSATHDATGELTVAAGDFSYSVTGTATVVVNIPATCVVGNCTAVENALEMVVDSATCTADGADCDCTLTVAASESSSGAYTASNGVADVANAENDEWYYCVGGDTLLLKEKTGQEPRPVYLLERQ